MRKLLASLLLMLLAACSAQTFKDVRPEIEFVESDLGRGRSVFLDVVEQPNDPLSHGLIVQGIVDKDFSLPLLLKREVRSALFNFGFATAHDGENADIGLQIELVDMAHIVTENTVLASLYLRNEVRLILKKTAVTHTFTYATQRTEKLPLKPSIQTSREEIGLIIADTLRRAFKDPAFLAELSAE